MGNKVSPIQRLIRLYEEKNGRKTPAELCPILNVTKEQVTKTHSRMKRLKTGKATPADFDIEGSLTLSQFVKEFYEFVTSNKKISIMEISENFNIDTDEVKQWLNIMIIMRQYCLPFYIVKLHQDPKVKEESNLVYNVMKSNPDITLEELAEKSGCSYEQTGLHVIGLSAHPIYKTLNFPEVPLHQIEELINQDFPENTNETSSDEEPFSIEAPGDIESSEHSMNESKTDSNKTNDEDEHPDTSNDEKGEPAMTEEPTTVNDNAPSMNYDDPDVARIIEYFNELPDSSKEMAAMELGLPVSKIGFLIKKYNLTFKKAEEKEAVETPVQKIQEETNIESEPKPDTNETITENIQETTAEHISSETKDIEKDPTLTEDSTNTPQEVSVNTDLAAEVKPSIAKKNSIKEEMEEKARRIVEYFRANPGATSRQASQSLGISQPTVSQYVSRIRDLPENQDVVFYKKPKKRSEEDLTVTANETTETLTVTDNVTESTVSDTTEEAESASADVISADATENSEITTSDETEAFVHPGTEVLIQNNTEEELSIEEAPVIEQTDISSEHIEDAAVEHEIEATDSNEEPSEENHATDENLHVEEVSKESSEDQTEEAVDTNIVESDADSDENNELNDDESSEEEIIEEKEKENESVSEFEKIMITGIAKTNPFMSKKEIAKLLNLPKSKVKALIKDGSIQDPKENLTEYILVFLDENPGATPEEISREISVSKKKIRKIMAKSFADKFSGLFI